VYILSLKYNQVGTAETVASVALVQTHKQVVLDAHGIVTLAVLVVVMLTRHSLVAVAAEGALLLSVLVVLEVMEHNLLYHLLLVALLLEHLTVPVVAAVVPQAEV
jgi:hypothetical protein